MGHVCCVECTNCLRNIGDVFCENKGGDWQDPRMIAKNHSGSEVGCKLKYSGGPHRQG